MEKIVSLERQILNKYSDRDLLDITKYFDPSIFLVTGNLSRKEKNRIESLTKVEVINPSSGLEKRELSDLTLVSFESINRMEKAINELERNKMCLISNFIEQKTDMKTLNTKLVNFQQYKELTKNINSDTLHLTTTLEAGKTFSKEGVKIHGIDTIEKMEGKRIPCVYLEDPLSLEPLPVERVGIQAVPEVGGKAKRKLKKNGYSSRSDLLKADPRNLLKIEGIGPHYASLYPAGAKAIEENKIVRFDDDPLENKRKVYIDIETDSLNPTIIWQIGLYDEKTNSYRYFIEDKDPQDVSSIIEEFSEWVYENASKGTFVSWHGSQFDYKHLNRFIKRHAKGKYAKAWEKAEKIDLLHEVAKSCVALPTRSFKLDIVSSRLGYERKVKGVTGAEAGEAYRSWMIQGEPEPEWEKWIKYCKDDVMSMKYVYDKISKAEKEINKENLKKLYRK